VFRLLIFNWTSYKNPLCILNANRTKFLIVFKAFKLADWHFFAEDAGDA